MLGGAAGDLKRPKRKPPYHSNSTLYRSYHSKLEGGARARPCGSGLAAPLAVPTSSSTPRSRSPHPSCRACTRLYMLCMLALASPLTSPRNAEHRHANGTAPQAGALHTTCERKEMPHHLEHTLDRPRALLAYARWAPFTIRACVRRLALSSMLSRPLRVRICPRRTYEQRHAMACNQRRLQGLQRVVQRDLPRS